MFTIILVNCLMVSTDRTIPKYGGKRLAGWNEEVRPLKDKSILWNKIWCETGCPSVGKSMQSLGTNMQLEGLLGIKT